MSRSMAERKLADLAADAPGLQERAEAWFLEHREEAGPTLIAALGDDGWGSVTHWRAMRLLSRLQIREALPAIKERLNAGSERNDPVLIHGAEEALAQFEP